MSVYKRGRVYWYEFFFAGKRIQEPAKTTSKTVAKEAEKDRRRELERTLAGLPAENRKDRIKSVLDVVKAYQTAYELSHRSQSIAFSEGRLEHVKRLLGNYLLPDLTEEVVRDYMRARLTEGVCGRTVNMEMGELSRAIGHHWSVLWPKVRKLEERKDVGKALSPAEEAKLLDALYEQVSPNASQTFPVIVRIAMLTGARSGEICELKWERIDFEARVITIGKAKSAAGTGRQIPMNETLFQLLSAHAAWFTKRFGETRPEYYLFPYGKPTPNDPRRHITDITSAWDSLRERAGVDCRFHDLRHTVATKMAEAGVPESTMLALLGHMSRAMLERYSHIRMAAKREAVKALELPSRERDSGENSDGVPTKVPTLTSLGKPQ